MAQDFADRIEIAGQLMHVGCCRMPQVMKPLVWHIEAGDNQIELPGDMGFIQWQTIGSG
jgi:hypothetical protein